MSAFKFLEQERQVIYTDLIELDQRMISPNQIIDRIEQIVNEREEWIPTSRHTPPIGEAVLIFVPMAKKWFYPQVGVYDGMVFREYDPDKEEPTFLQNTYWEFGAVTHWQPAPTPPK